MKTSTMCVAIGFLFVTGCAKYENGPDFSIKSKKERITNNWTVNEAIHLSGDAGSFHDVYVDYRLNIGEDEKYTKYYRPNGIGFCNERGTWKFTNGKLSFVTTCEDGREIEYQILRLAGNELWVRFTDQGNEWELHLHPKSTM